jgi:filamentous hemagglutinin family protein
MPSVIAWQYSPVRTQNAQDCLCCYDAYYQFSSQLVKLPHYTMKTLHNTHSARTREWVKHVPHVRCSEMGFFVDANLYKTKQVKKLRRLNCLIQILILVLLIILPKQASYALPEVDTVVSGQAEVTYPNTATLQINSTDAKTIINYKSFNIAENESVVVNMPSADSAVLNRVLGGGLSEILGKLSSNGIFILINPNGIHIGPKVEINVASMIASTRDITNSDFLSANYVFSKLNDIEKEALLLNEGKINVLQGGFVSLIGAAVENKGAILCPLGTISLAAGDKVTLGITGNSLISVAIDLPTSSKVYDASGRPVTEQVKNSGTLQADGGMILINAESIPGIFEKAINLDGYVRANQVETHEGSIKLTTNGKVSASSTLLAKNIEFYSKNGISLFNSALNDGLVNLTGENINITYLATANLTLKTDNAINTTPGVIIEANQVRVIAKQFGTQEVPLHINANLTYINRTAGNIDILESTGLGTSIMLRGPPGGFGAIIYNRDTELTLDAAKISLIGPDSIHLYGNITFSNLECIIPAKEIYFEAGKTYTILGEFKVLGAYAQHIKLLSSEQDKQWYINPQGSRDLVYTWVQDSYNLGTEIVMTLSTNRGNCFAWDPVITWGGGVGNWNVGSNWVGGVAPGAGDDAVISGGTCTVTANASIVNLTVASGATLSINNARTLTVTGDLSLNGTISGAGALTMSGAAGKTLSGAGSFTSTGIFTINTGAKTLSNGSNLSIRNLTVTGVTLTNNGTLTVSSALAGTGGLTQGVGAVLNISGTSTITTLTATASPNTVNYNGAAQTVKAVTYYNLTISTAGIKTLGGNITVSGALTVSAGTLTPAGFTVNGTPGGTLSVTGTIQADKANFTDTYIGFGTITLNAGSTIDYNGAMPQTIDNTLSYQNLTASGTANKTTAGTINVSGTFTITSVTVTNNGTLTVSSALAGTGGLTQGVGAVLNISGTSTITTLTATASPNTVNYNGAAQTVKAVTYHHLTTSGSGTKTLGGNTAINGDLLINSGTALTIGAFTSTVTGQTTINGTINITSTTGTKTFVGMVTIGSGGIWNTSANEAITFRGGLTYNGTTFTPGTGVYTFDTNNQTIGGNNAIAIPNLTVTGVTLTNNGTLTVSSALAGTGGLTQGVGAVLNISGTSTITTLTATASPNTVNYNGAAQTVKAVTYYNLTLSGSGAKALASGTSVTNSLSIAPTGSAIANIGAGLTISVNNLVLGGLGRINGTWGSTTSTATYQDNTYFTATTGKLSVITDTRSTPTATLSTTNSPVTYNGSAQSATVGITTSSVPGSVANILLDGAANQTNAGTYAVTADFIPTDITSYKSLTGLSAGNFTINKAPLSITANNKNKTYGDTVTFTGTEFSSAGLQNLETIGNVALVSAGAISTASVASSPYTITPSNATGGTFNTNNYNITYINGSLTVNKADLTITANDQAKTYGETFTFTGNEFTSNGLRNLESIGSVTLNSLGAPGTASTGTYPIIPSAATGGTFNSSNYNIAYMNGTLDIKAAPQPPKNNTITNGALEIYLIVKHIEDQRTKWNLANIFGRKITVFQNINSLKGLGIIFIPQEGTTIFSSY